MRSLRTNIRGYLDPMSRFGKKTYSILFPLFGTIIVYSFIELYFFYTAKNSVAVGTPAIFLAFVCIIYFSFRDGIQGGVIATAITVIYYLYLIFRLHYAGEQLWSGLTTTAILAAVYLLIGAIIGWLRQTIDTLFVKEQEARRQAEEGKLWIQTILDQLPVGVLLVDLATHSIEGNKQVEKLTGRKVKKRLNKHPLYQSTYSFKDDKALLQKNWPITRAIQKGEVVTAEQIEYIKPNNDHVYLRVNAVPIRNKQKQVIAAVATLYDITQEKQQEQRKDDFVNMASHELKTPVTSMKLYIESLIRKPTIIQDEKSLRIVNNVKTQIEKLQDLVSDLLDVSRIHTGKLQLQKEVFRLDTLIEQTIDAIQETTSTHHIIFKSHQVVKVYGDRFRIDQVLTNLLTNAIKYSPEGTDIIVEIKKEKKHVIVSVKDFGLGIHEDQYEKIFEKLYQVTDPKEQTFPGLGMGLYISKEIIKRHNGKIWVASKKGKGSTFYFSLPSAILDTHVQK